MRKKKQSLHREPETARAGILQIMPGGRVRLDPSVVADVAAWIHAASKRWRTIAAKHERGLEGKARAQVVGERQAANAALSVLSVLMSGLLDSVSLDEIEDARQAWAAGLADPIPPPQRPSDRPEYTYRGPGE